MELRLIGRGLLAGAVGGLVAFIFARIFIEPVIAKAIDFESAHEHEHGAELFSRSVQENIGAGSALLIFGAAMGALVAVAFVVALGRTGTIRPFSLALLIPAFGFVGIYLVPFAKYPTNPPAIGLPDTIRERGALYLVVVASSCLALFLAVYFGQRVYRRLNLYSTCVLMGFAYLTVMSVLFIGLKSFHETPAGFPADVLAQFRVYSIVAQAIIWGVIGLVFAPLATKVVSDAQKA